MLRKRLHDHAALVLLETTLCLTRPEHDFIQLMVITEMGIVVNVRVSRVLYHTCVVGREKKVAKSIRYLTVRDNGYLIKR